MAKDMGAKKGSGKGAVCLPDKGSRGYKDGGKVKMAAGGAAKSRKDFPMTKKTPAPKKK
jgi:hypothetical protein